MISIQFWSHIISIFKFCSHNSSNAKIPNFHYRNPKTHIRYYISSLSNALQLELHRIEIEFIHTRHWKWLEEVNRGRTSPHWRPKFVNSRTESPATPLLQQSNPVKLNTLKQRNKKSFLKCQHFSIKSTKFTDQKKGGDGFISPTMLFQQMTNDDTEAEECEEDSECNNGGGVKKWVLECMNGFKNCHFWIWVAEFGIHVCGDDGKKRERFGP